MNDPAAANTGLRRYIDLLDSRGALVRVSRRVRPVYEIGEMTRRAGAPVLFENIEGYPGMSVFVNGLSTRACFALCLGLDPAGMSWKKLACEVRRRCRAVEPVVTADRIDRREQRGRAVDLSVLPVPWWHRADVGRYAGTWHVNLTRDARTGVGNAGVYRMLVLDRRHMTVSVSPKSHLARHMNEAERRGEPLPMAVAVGVPEPVVIAAAAAARAGRDELCLAGGLMRQPLPVARCRTVDLTVPAGAEVIMEGEIVPGVRVKDGPYMDYAGTPNVNPRALLYRVRRLAWRADTVYRGTSVGVAGGEDHHLFAVLAGAGLADFHGSAVRRTVQNLLLRCRMFRLFQLSGRLSQGLHRQ